MNFADYGRYYGYSVQLSVTLGCSFERLGGQ